MKPQRAIAIASALALCAPLLAGAAQKAKDDAARETPGSWYAQRVTDGDAGVAVEHFWSKGRKLRAEIVVQGIEVQTLVSGDLYTIVDVTNQTGVAIRRAPEALAVDRAHPSERPFGREGDEIQKLGELVRSDNLAGRPCRVYRQTDQNGKREVWITDDKRKLPLRVDLFARQDGSQRTSHYLDWLSDLPLPDSFFEPDPRVKLETVEYADYLKRVAEGPVGPAPVLFAPLLHGK